MVKSLCCDNYEFLMSFGQRRCWTPTNVTQCMQSGSAMPKLGDGNGKIGVAEGGDHNENAFNVSDDDYDDDYVSMNIDDSYFDHNSVFWQVKVAATVSRSGSDANCE